MWGLSERAELLRFCSDDDDDDDDDDGVCVCVSVSVCVCVRVVGRGDGGVFSFPESESYLLPAFHMRWSRQAWFVSAALSLGCACLTPAQTHQG